VPSTKSGPLRQESFCFGALFLPFKFEKVHFENQFGKNLPAQTANYRYHLISKIELSQTYSK